MDWTHDPRSESAHEKHDPKSVPTKEDADAILVDKVSLTLYLCPEVDAHNIQISATQGRVTLNGSVPNRYQKKAAEQWTGSLPEVLDVENLLEITSVKRTA